MSEAVCTIDAKGSLSKAGLSVRTLATVLLSAFALDNLLLLHFGGLPLSVTAGLVLLAVLGFRALCSNIPDDLPRVPLATFAVGLAVSLALFALGGEGRFFYANLDWEVRDAVLRDLATHHWPFAYEIGGKPYVLRAPLGTYLFPALFRADDEVALLVWNALRLSLLFALGTQLFEKNRDRCIALAVFIIFSGWDVVGTALYSWLGVNVSWDHLETWNLGDQYSSHITQAFWVPQHALAGWTCAVGFLLWRRGIVPIGFFAACVPLVALWSPLAIMGAVPFAIYAGATALRNRSVSWNDVALAVLSVGIALPGLIYLQIDAASLGMHARTTNPLVWVLCIGLEVLPFAWPLIRSSGTLSTDRPVLLLVVLLLSLMPLAQIGANVDFQMRASIMPLALLAILFARWLCKLLEQRPLPRVALAYAIVALGLGAATPLHEVRRALVNVPSPRPLCSLVGVWTKQDNMIAPYATYFAPVSMLPSYLQSIPVSAGKSDPAKCWDRKWVKPSLD